MVILDENLIHAGTKSMTSGYAPIPSPRYFTYINPKVDDTEKDFTYHKFDLCGADYAYCNNSGVIEE